MTNGLDTPATALYATTDDLLKERPELTPWRPAVGIAPQLTDAELVALSMMQTRLAGAPVSACWTLKFDRLSVVRTVKSYQGQRSGP